MKNVIALLLSLVAVIAAFISCGEEEEIKIPKGDLVESRVAEARFFKGHYNSDEFGFIPCENARSLGQSAVDHLPVQKIDSLEQLEQLKANLMTEDGLFDYSTKFDDAFFEENILLAAYVESGSGSYRYYLSNMYIENGGLTVGISQKLMPPDICVTADMAYWIVLVEVERDKIAGVETFDAIAETRHSYYDEQGDFYSPMLTLDENSKEYYFVYYKDKSRNEIYGSFERNEDNLILKSSDGNLVFDVDGDGLVLEKITNSDVSSFVKPKTALTKLR